MNVAVCFSGISRNVESGLKSLNLISPNDNIKVFAHTWVNVNNEKNYHNDVLDIGSINDFHLLKKFNFENILIENYQSKREYFQRIYDLLNFKDRPGSPPRSDLGILSMFYSMYRSNLLKCEYEEQNNIKFDKVVRIRFDTDFHNQVLNLENINGELCIPRGNDFEGLNDQFAIGSSETIDTYSNVFNSLSSLDYVIPYNPEVILKEYLSINRVNIERFQFDMSLRRSRRTKNRILFRENEYNEKKYLSNKLVIFDLDNVLIDSKELHYETLNLALSNVDEKYIISRDEHLNFYNGLSTFKKLKLLSEKKNLPVDVHQQVWVDKQKKTFDTFCKLTKDTQLTKYFCDLKLKNYKIAITSNTIEKTVRLILTNLGLMGYIDYYISNEDVEYDKPFPEIYWKCMSNCNALPKDTIIFENNYIDGYGTLDIGATFIFVDNREDLNKKIEVVV